MPLEILPNVKRVTAGEIEAARRQFNMNDAELGAALGGLSGAIVNNYRRGTKPISDRFSRRFRAWLDAGVKPLPAWKPDPSAIPLRRLVGGYIRQCPECIAECHEGQRAEPDTWWWFASPSRVYCTKEHGKVHRRRSRKHKSDVAVPALNGNRHKEAV